MKRTLLSISVLAISTTGISRRYPSSVASAYVTSGLPPTKHRQWLEQMTTEMMSTKVGQLTPEMIEAAPDLMSAWAQNPYASDASVRSTNTPPPLDPEGRGRDCALAVEKLMKRLVAEQTATGSSDVATTYAYNALLHGWARSGEGGYAAQRAEQILIEMQDRFEAGNTCVQPNTASFRSVLLAWQRSGETNDAAQRAQRMLNWMISLNQAGANDEAQPNTECFDIAMHAWTISGHPDTPRMVEELLVTMDRLYRDGNVSAKPNTRCYNYVLSAWSQSGQPGAAKRAQEVLDHMSKLSQLEYPYNQIKPDFNSYNTVSRTWANSHEKCSARKAESVLKRMETSYKETGDPSLQPDSVMFNVCIDAWSQTKSMAKTNGRLPYEAARNILDRQISLYEDGAQNCRPDVYGYTSVVKACENLASRSKRQREKAFGVAEATFLELCGSDYASANHVAYGTMLKCVAHLLPQGSPRREQIARQVFEKACRDGCVGSMVLSRFKEAATPALYKELMGNVKKNDLPYDWTFRVPRSDKKLHRQRKKKGPPPSRINKKTGLRP